MQNNAAQSWQQALSDAFTSIEELCEYLKLNITELNCSPISKQNFPLKIPRRFADCIEKGNPNDPVLRQILPHKDELIRFPGFTNDPVGDLTSSPMPGILHKYHGRALLITTGTCAINCRYCFRRNFPYSELQLTNSRIQQVLDYIKTNPNLSEIILSGGDPLLLSDKNLQTLFESLNALKQIRRIRIHSRIPVVLTERITDNFLDILALPRAKVILVIHANHANELSPYVASVCRRLAVQGVTLLNQSVLLKDINDTAWHLELLSEKLFEIGVLPYYLHLLDKAAGTGHFEVQKELAIQLHKELQARLPGYLVPKLVEEQAGAAHKILIHA